MPSRTILSLQGSRPIFLSASYQLLGESVVQSKDCYIQKECMTIQMLVNFVVAVYSRPASPLSV